MSSPSPSSSSYSSLSSAEPTPSPSPGSSTTRQSAVSETPRNQLVRYEDTPDKKDSDPSWIQKGLLVMDLAKEKEINRELEYQVQQQEETISDLSSDISVHEEALADSEAQSEANRAAAQRLRTALIRQVKQAEVSESYTGEVELRCSELEIANQSVRQVSADREKVLNRQIHHMEDRVQELEKAATESSTDLRLYQGQIKRDTEHWFDLRRAIEASNLGEQEKVGRLNDGIARTMQLADRAEAMCRTIMQQQTGFHRAEVDVRRAMTAGQRLSSHLGLTQPPDAKDMSGDKDMMDGVSSFKDDAPNDKDTIMRSTTPSVASEPYSPMHTEMDLPANPGPDFMEGVKPTGPGVSWVQGVWPPIPPPSPVSSVDSVWEGDTAVISCPPSIRLPPRKRARYIMASDESSSSDESDLFDLDDLPMPTFKRMKVCGGCGRPDQVPPYENPVGTVEMADAPILEPETGTFGSIPKAAADPQRNPAPQNVGYRPSSGSPPKSPPASKPARSNSSVQMTPPFVVHAVHPEPPRLKDSPMVSQGTQVSDRQARWDLAIEAGELPIRSVQTQTDKPPVRNQGTQTDRGRVSRSREKRKTAMRVDKHKTSRLRPRPRSWPLTRPQRALEPKRYSMPGKWPLSPVPEDAAHGSDMAEAPRHSGSTMHGILDSYQQVHHGVVTWLTRLLQMQPREMIYSVVGLAALLYLWHGHRVHRHWMLVNEIPRSVVEGLRNRPMSDSGMVESITFGLTTAFNVDRSTLG